jgi:hypothetical protein
MAVSPDAPRQQEISANCPENLKTSAPTMLQSPYIDLIVNVCVRPRHVRSLLDTFSQPAATVPCESSRIPGNYGNQVFASHRMSVSYVDRYDAIASTPLPCIKPWMPLGTMVCQIYQCGAQPPLLLTCHTVVLLSISSSTKRFCGASLCLVSCAPI